MCARGGREREGGGGGSAVRYRHPHNLASNVMVGQAVCFDSCSHAPVTLTIPSAPAGRICPVLPFTNLPGWLRPTDPGWPFPTRIGGIVCRGGRSWQADRPATNANPRGCATNRQHLQGDAAVSSAAEVPPAQVAKEQARKTSLMRRFGSWLASSVTKGLRQRVLQIPNWQPAFCQRNRCVFMTNSPVIGTEAADH